MTSPTEKRKKSTDRRIVETDLRRRKFNRRERTYSYERDIYLSDTNAYQNVYFAKFFIFLGEAREDWLLWVLGKDTASFMQSGIGMVTVDCSIKYKASLYCFDRIKVVIRVLKLSRTKLYFEFRVTNVRTGQLCAVAEMSCGAVLNGRPIAFPEQIAAPVRKYFI